MTDRPASDDPTGASGASTPKPKVTRARTTAVGMPASTPARTSPKPAAKPASTAKPAADKPAAAKLTTQKPAAAAKPASEKPAAPAKPTSSAPLPVAADLVTTQTVSGRGYGDVEVGPSISHGGIDTVKATRVDVRQGGISRVDAEDVNVTMGGIAIARADPSRPR